MEEEGCLGSTYTNVHSTAFRTIATAAAPLATPMEMSAGSGTAPGLSPTSTALMMGTWEDSKRGTEGQGTIRTSQEKDEEAVPQAVYFTTCIFCCHFQPDTRRPPWR